jgi:transposase, IS5 family
MKNKNERGFFDEQFRLERLASKEDPLTKLDKVIRWEDFRFIIENAFPKTDPKLGGRPAFDRVMMFKVLVLQSLYNISDANTEFQILDRLTFMRFLGLNLSDRVPDEKTIWLFREQLKEHKIFDDLFDFFRNKIQVAGLFVEKGQIVDANIIEVPRQRNTREENQQIKDGEVPEQWKDDQNKLRQKDMDADWLKKNGKNYYGYKNHIKIDQGSKLIQQYQVTPASVHDSDVLEDLLEKKDRSQSLHADSAYSGDRCKSLIRKFKMKDKVHEKGYRNLPLTKKQMASNRKKSTIRARVEHVFGFMHMNMNHRLGLKYIGMDRIASAIGLKNIVYNMCRVVYLVQEERCV